MPPGGWTAAELTDQLAETWASVTDLCSSLDAAQWRTATDCPGWDVRAQLGHLIGTESMLLGEPLPPFGGEYPAHARNDIGRFNEAWLAALADLDDAALLERWRSVTAARLAALPDLDWEAVGPTPVGQAPYRRFMEIRVFDCFAHEQDIRVALDRPGHTAGPAVDRSVEEVAGALGFLMGKRAALPNGSSVRFAVGGRPIDVVVDGRARVADTPVAEPSATVTTDPVTWVRLGCGRLGGEDAVAAGLVTLAGDRELAGRAASYLAFTM